MPRLEQVVPRLPPNVLHRVIQSCGLEDCGELVALATSEQVAHIFDLDLWRAGRPGLDEQFDAARFGVWIEVLVEFGAQPAAQKLAGMDVDLVIAGLARHLLVYDRAAVVPYETLDGEQIEGCHALDDALTFDMGGYLLVARRADSWEAIIEVLLALADGHRQYFGRVMSGCRTLSNSGREIDGLDDLFAEDDQAMFDLAVDREGRREKQGYVPPAQARAFLEMARELRPRSDSMQSSNPLSSAYFRALEERPNVDPEPELLAAPSQALPASEDIGEAVAAVFDVLLEAGVLEQAPRALLGGSEAHAPRLDRIQAHMQFVLDHDQAAYSTRNQELAYLANTLMAGCSIQGRPFTAQEASDAAVAVCNLGLENLGLENWGLENWGLENCGLENWGLENCGLEDSRSENRGLENRGLETSGLDNFENRQPGSLAANAASLSGSFLIDHDLVSVFQVGWAVLHRKVCMFAAEQLISVLTRIQCDDSEIQIWLDGLRIELSKHWRARAPWRSRDKLDVIAILDMPSLAVLLALIDECPVLHTGVSASRDSRPLSVSPSDFEFISENSQIAAVREFMRSLPERLRC
jgi:hypothetical protein